MNINKYNSNNIATNAWRCLFPSEEINWTTISIDLNLDGGLDSANLTAIDLQKSLKRNKNMPWDLISFAADETLAYYVESFGKNNIDIKYILFKALICFLLLTDSHRFVGNRLEFYWVKFNRWAIAAEDYIDIDTLVLAGCYVLSVEMFDH